MMCFSTDMHAMCGNTGNPDRGKTKTIKRTNKIQINMKTLKILSAAAVVAAMAASCTSSPKSITVEKDGETTTISLPDAALTDSVSYLVGVNFGYFIKANNFGEDLNYAKIKKGMFDFINAEGNMNDPEFNSKFDISPDQMNQLFNKFISARREFEAESNKAASEAFLKENAQKDGIITTESGLQYQIIESGNEVKPGEKDTVFVHYTGTLIDGTEFDASDPEKDPVRMQMNRVIKGWTEGLQLIGEGGHIKLFIPADLGYGMRGTGAIKPNSALIFDVELVKVGKAPADKAEDKK